MEGGKYLASGQDTCVFNPPVACKEPEKTIDPTGKVSRVVAKGSGEWDLQQELKKRLVDLEKFVPGVSLHFNVAVDHCTPAFKKEDEYVKCLADPVIDSYISDLDNLVTPIQGKDLADSLQAFPRPVIMAALHRLMIAMLEINTAGFIHDDAHFGNIAWMVRGRDMRLVMHDWGRAKAGDRIASYIREYKNTTPNTQKAYYKSFPQHIYILNFLDNSLGALPGMASTKGACDWRAEKRMILYATCLWDTFGILGVMVRKGLMDPDRMKVFFGKLSLLFANKTADGKPLLPSIEEDYIRPYVRGLLNDMFGEKANIQPLMSDAESDAYLGPLMNKKGGSSSPYVEQPMTPEEAKRIGDLMGLIGIQCGSIVGGKTQMKTRMSKKFDTCVKSVRKTVRARKGSNKESAAIAICTKSVLQKRGRTMKRYRKGHLLTQRKFH